MIKSERRSQGERLIYLFIHSANTYSMTTIFQVLYPSMHLAQVTEGKNEWLITLHNSDSLVWGGDGRQKLSWGPGAALEDFTHVIRGHSSSSFPSKKGSWAQPNTRQHVRWLHMLPRFWYNSHVGRVCYPNCINKKTEFYRVNVTCQSHSGRKTDPRFV